MDEWEKEFEKWADRYRYEFDSLRERATAKGAWEEAWALGYAKGKKDFGRDA